ncbi:DUF2637 domain-containing protein [Streptomyces sp. NPDC056728]
MGGWRLLGWSTSSCTSRRPRGQGGCKAWAYPVSVDLLVIAAWRRIRSDVPAQRKGAWFWFGLALAASLAANVATAAVLDMENLPTGLRVLVAGWPAVAFLGGSLLVHARKTPADEEFEPPVNEPQKPVLVSYADADADAADALGVAPETIRGAANGPKARLTKYSGQTPNSVRVDLNEARRVIRRPVIAP